MFSPVEDEGGALTHIDIHDERVAPREDADAASPGLRNTRGWDGKLRIPKSAQITNPGALSDPEHSDDSNILPGEEISADQDLLESEDSASGEIMCSHSRVASISALGLQRFRNAVRVCLRQNSIQKIDGLDPLAETLEDLDLYDNLISHIRGLDKLLKLKMLDLSFNKIKHIKNIDHLTKLNELFLVANKISKIEGLEGLSNLTSLELGSNRIRELENLDRLDRLEELWVAKNKITSLNGLNQLPRLRLLSIQSNRISDLSPLSEVSSLRELYVSHNILETLEGLRSNEKLEILDVSNNKVGSLQGLATLGQLEELWASYNQLGDFGELERTLWDKHSLRTVYFEGNPIQLRSPALYRNKVRLALPQITQIDASESSARLTMENGGADAEFLAFVKF